MSRLTRLSLILAASALPVATMPTAVLAQPQTLDFGDDAGDYTNDGECDDMRFSGPGMTDTPLLEEDIGHDASDCRNAFFRGELSYNSGYRAVGQIEWGGDSGDYANDGECDDMRFTGEAMTDTPLLTEDLGNDATDCRSAFMRGKLQVNPLFVKTGGIDFGDDKGDFAKDGECDDLRFSGIGMTDTPLLGDDVGHDASDCRKAFDEGRLQWRGEMVYLDASGD